MYKQKIFFFKICLGHKSCILGYGSVLRLVTGSSVTSLLVTHCLLRSKLLKMTSKFFKHTSSVTSVMPNIVTWSPLSRSQLVHNDAQNQDTKCMHSYCKTLINSHFETTRSISHGFSVTSQSMVHRLNRISP